MSFGAKSVFVSYLNEIKSLIFLKDGLFDIMLNFPLF